MIVVVKARIYFLYIYHRLIFQCELILSEIGKHSLANKALKNFAAYKLKEIGWKFLTHCLLFFYVLEVHWLFSIEKRIPLSINEH